MTCSPSRPRALGLFLALAVFVGPGCAAFGQKPAKPAAGATKPEDKESGEKTPRPPKFDYAGYNALFTRYVVDGHVDYATWKKDGTKELDGVLAAMSTYPYTRNLAREERLSFLINYYNAAVIRAILEAYPVKSVKDIPGFFDTAKHPLNGSSVTLDEIEKTLIHGTFKDFPNYHFALVCGAMGCPPLRPRAFVGDSLQFQMSSNLGAFAADSTKVHYEGSDHSLHVSELFKWYGADFETGDQTIPRFLAPNFSLGTTLKILKEEPRLEYVPFDWALNASPPRGGGQ